MSVGWSSDAQTAILNNCRVLFTAFIDVEQDGTGSYGVQIIDISDYVLRPWPRIKKESSAINRKWETAPITLRLNNSTGYFTPNLCGNAKDQITNIWQERPSGEAELRECKVYIKEKVWLADNSTEEKTRFQGMIIDYNPIIDKSQMIMELVVRDQLLDALDRVFEIGDGGTDYVDVTL